MNMSRWPKKALDWILLGKQTGQTETYMDPRNRRSNDSKKFTRRRMADWKNLGSRGKETATANRTTLLYIYICNTYCIVTVCPEWRKVGWIEVFPRFIVENVIV
jgi:hypothetical protein